MVKSVYIHIPFCKTICSYCDFCKMFYKSEWVDNYLIQLEKEIKNKYKSELLNTIYIGGGTPSCLNIKQTKNLLEICNVFNKEKNIEFTIECNIENIDEEKIKLYKDYGINRLSIGIQTFNNEFLTFLNRNHTKEEIFEKINMCKKYFDNINIDLMYGLKNQTLIQLKEDINEFLKLDITHISTYSLILEPHTKLYVDGVENIDEELDYEMFKLINSELIKNNYNHYEFSNYAKDGYESKHNLVYWDNLEYYGFGLGASGYLNNIRYDNTKGLNNYLNGEYILDSHSLTLEEKIENEFILGLRKIKGINKQEFTKKYNFDILKVPNVLKLIEEGKLIDDGKSLYISKEYLYMSNQILINFIGN